MAVPQHQINVHDDKYGEPHEDVVEKLSGSRDSQPMSEKEKDEKDTEEVAVDTEAQSSKGPKPTTNWARQLGRKLRPHRMLIHVTVWLLVTTWWIVGLVYHRHDMNWVQPFLLWLLITIRLVTFYVPARYALVPAQFVWGRGVDAIENVVPKSFRTLAGAAIVFVALLLGVFIPGETHYNKRSDRAVSVFGYIVFLVGLWATSRHRHAINWRPVIVGILVQFIMGFFVLRTQLGKDIFKFISDALTTLLTFAYQGVFFLTDNTVTSLGWFLVNSLSVYIFFVALVQMAYYAGLVQWVVPKIAYPSAWAFRLSGVEALAVSVTPFLGMGEAAIIIKGFISLMTEAEIHQVLTAGFATISGALMVVYIGLGASGQAVISSCLMSIPISVVISRMRVPETEEPLTLSHVSVSNNNIDNEAGEETNILHAMANGAWVGLKVAGMVAANLIVIISLVALCNGILHWTFKYIQAPNLTITQIFGYIFYPVAFLMGVPRDELYLVGKLIGMKTIQNEFVAFAALTGQAEFKAMSARSNIIATYAVCGFANIGSIGIQLGIYGQLSPERRGAFAKNAVSACICGALATFMSASLAGMIFTG